MLYSANAQRKVPGARGSPAVVLPRGAGDFLSGCRFLRSSCRRCALCVAAQGATRFLPPGGAFPPRGGLYAFAPSRDVSRGHVTQGQPVRSARAGPGSVWRKEGTGSRRTPAGPGRAVGSGAGGAGPGRAEPSRSRPGGAPQCPAARRGLGRTWGLLTSGARAAFAAGRPRARRLYSHLGGEGPASSAR